MVTPARLPPGRCRAGCGTGASVRDRHRAVGHLAVPQKPGAVGGEVDAGGRGRGTRGRRSTLWRGGRRSTRCPGRRRTRCRRRCRGRPGPRCRARHRVHPGGSGVAGASVGDGAGGSTTAGPARTPASGRSGAGRPPSARTAAGRAPGALPSTMPTSSPLAATSATTPNPHPARTCRPPRSPRPGTSRRDHATVEHRRRGAARPASRPDRVVTTPRPGTRERCQGRSGGSAASCSSVRSKSTDE